MIDVKLMTAASDSNGLSGLHVCESRMEQLRRRLHRGGHMTKWKGLVASVAPVMGAVMTVSMSGLAAAVVAPGAAHAGVRCELQDDLSGLGNPGLFDNGGAEANGDFALACGIFADALGDQSTAIGRDADALGDRSTAIGSFSQALGEDTVALGNGAVANNPRDVALGASSVTGAVGTVNYGTGNTPTAVGVVAVGNRRIQGLAAGGEPLDAVNVNQLRQQAINLETVLGSDVLNTDGTLSGAAFDYTGPTSVTDGTVQGGFDAIGTDINNIINGSTQAAFFKANSTLPGDPDASATGDDALALGTTADAQGNQSIAIGVGAQTASGAADGIAVGTGAQSFGSVALGAAAAAAGGGTAVGDNAQAGVAGGVPDGTLNNNAFGNDAFALGGDSTALGFSADADSGNVALGANSQALGAPTGTGYGTGDAAPASMVSIGAAGSERRMGNVAAGAADTDAANVAQLRNQAQNIDDALGQELFNNDGTANALSFNTGGVATVQTITEALNAQDAFNVAQGNSLINDIVGVGSYDTTTGAWTSGLSYTGPTSVAAGGTVQQVFDAIGADVDANATNIAGNTTNIDNIINGSVGLVQQSGMSSDPITVGAATGGTSVDFTGTQGARVLTGVDAGNIAAGSRDAVNGSQIAVIGGNINNALGSGDVINGVAPTFQSINGGTTGNVAGALDEISTQVDANTVSITNLTGGPGFNAFVTDGSPTNGPTATGSEASAGGARADASGERALALGADATAGAANATAVGSDANASFANSTAVGTGATTTMENQMVLGTAATRITAESIRDNSGDISNDRIVSIDADGHLASVGVNDIVERATVNIVNGITVVGGSDSDPVGPNQIRIADNSITNAELANNSVSTRNIQDGAVTLSKLGNDVIQQFNSLEEQVDEANAGVALAMAMANVPSLSHNRDYSIALAVGTFRGEVGYTMGFNARFSDELVSRVSVGGTSQGDFGIAGGLAWEF